MAELATQNQSQETILSEPSQGGEQGKQAGPVNEAKGEALLVDDANRQ